MTELITLDYLVLDKMLDDMESIETILSMLNHPEFGGLARNEGQLFTPREVEASLRRLIATGLIRRMYCLSTTQCDEIEKTPPRNTLFF